MNPTGPNLADEEFVKTTRNGLYNILILWTKGEPNQIVRNVGEVDGYVTWKKLYDRYNPRTPASMAAAWRDIIRTKKMRDLRDAGKVLEIWEGKIDLLKREYSEEVPEGLKAALLMEMLPESVQMGVAQGISDQFDFEALKSKVRLMASVQTEMATPKPMDVDELAEHQGDWGQEATEGNEVEAVGKGKGRSGGPMYGSCWTCGGAHFQSECPKGSGKGQKGKGKSDGAQKGKGKGKARAPMFGSCWTCGGAHFSADCPKGSGKSKGKGKHLREVDEWGEDQDHQEEVGSVSECWNICCLDARRRPRRSMHIAAYPRGPCLHKRETSTKNRFEVLRDNDGEDHLYIDQVDMKPNMIDEPIVVGGKGQEREHIRDDINWVSEEKNHDVIGKGEIIVDSGAAESVCPWGWAEAFPIKEIPESRKRDFRNASGDPMGHYGERRVRCGIEGLSAPVSMLFQVSDARNPLALVARITKQGNIVQFGPKDDDNYIYNPTTDEKIRLRRKGRKFVVDVSFLASRPPFSGRA